MAYDHDTGHDGPPAAVPLPTLSARAAVVATSDGRLAVDLLEAELADPTGQDPAPDVLIVFVNDAWQAHYGAILAELRQRTGAATVIGASAGGVLANGHEYEDVPGISALALWLPGVTATPVRLHQESVPLLEEPETWHATTGVDPAGVRGILLLADPYRMDSNALISGLRGSYPGVPIAGGMASASEHRRQAWVFIDGQVYDEGGVALLLEGSVRLIPVVSHGAEPVGETWTITKIDRNTILEIGHRPALDVLLDTACPNHAGRDAAELPLGEWLIGFPVDEYQDRFGRGDFIVRGILGSDPQARSVVVGGKPRLGQTVQFQRRDPALASAELRQRLAAMRALLPETPPAALLFTCNGRGEDMFGAPHHDATVVEEMLAGTPVAGMFCNGEIGPAGPTGEPVLHGFTATLALLVPNTHGDS
jgi:small ligand-binding sensory domain FIST